MAPDPWFSAYDATCQIAQDIAEKIQQQNQHGRSGENTIRLTVTIRALLQSLKEKIALLKDLLLRAVSTHQITQLEGDRRQNLLDELITRERLLLASFKNEGAEPDLIRSSLMTGGAKRGVPNPWLFEEPEETRGLGFDEIRQQQQKIIQEQDAGLDALSSIISRQKQMGKEIGNELDEQNEIIDDLANLVENTDGKLRTETRRMNIVDRKSTSCVISFLSLCERKNCEKLSVKKATNRKDRWRPSALLEIGRDGHGDFTAARGHCGRGGLAHQLVAVKGPPSCDTRQRRTKARHPVGTRESCSQ
ncbi:syntaxin-8 [Herpailurus yagouaroundi]|uniref:syntaxin-8 n=1 Tax=Herpailurus yagouaroundi TaxID=1608482 RepID=UPI001AD63608|nr:syntaxin-8 [Puma yagouaroundi]